MKKILIVSFSPIRSDPRVMRQIRLLENQYLLTVAGYGPKPDANIAYIEISQPIKNIPTKLFFALKLAVRLYEHYYWNLPNVKQLTQKVESQSFDLIIANDINTLPWSIKNKKNAKILTDAHEYSPKELDDNLLWRIFFKNYNEYLCQRYLSKADAMLTVCQGIAEEYAKNFFVKPSIVFNAPKYQNLSPSNTVKNLKLIHHGSSARARHLELMISMMDDLDERFTLDFMLVETDAAYMRELKRLASKNPRIRFVTPVKMEEICKKLNDYDIGVYILPPDNFNHEYALPNKFFEFIQANLAIAIGPSKEMATLVKKYSCGIVSESFAPESLAKALNSLTHTDIARFKVASSMAAQELSYEASAKVLLEEVKTLIH